MCRNESISNRCALQVYRQNFSRKLSFLLSEKDRKASLQPFSPARDCFAQKLSEASEVSNPEKAAVCARHNPMPSEIPHCAI